VVRALLHLPRTRQFLRQPHATPLPRNKSVREAAPNVVASSLRRSRTASGSHEMGRRRLDRRRPAPTLPDHASIVAAAPRRWRHGDQQMKPSNLVSKLAAAAESDSTRRSYAADLRHFKSCGGRIPATPELVANYLAKNSARLAVATLEHRLVAIHKAHQSIGMPSPTKSVLVKRTMQGIRRTQGTAQRRMRALVRDDLVEVLAVAAKQKPMKASRDMALLLVGFAGAFRRSELVALNTEDMTVYSHGIELLIRRSKTDQEGVGRTVFIPKARAAERCPVQALTTWLRVAGIAHGAIFRAVNRHDHIASQRLSAQAVALIVRTLVSSTKGDDAAKLFGGHSLRAGFVTEAAMAGLPTSAIMGQTGHRSLEMVLRYIRPVEKRNLPTLL